MGRMFKVTAERRAYRHCPLWFELGDGEVGSEALSATDVDTGRAYPVQVEPCPDTGKSYGAMVLDRIGCGETRRFELKQAAGGRAAVRVREAGGERVEVRIGRQLFSTYHYAGGVARPFLHPLAGPYGAPVTRGFPMLRDVPGETDDHVHHRSCWTAWGDVNGVDDWSENEQHGWIVHQRFERLASGKVLGRVRALNHWTAHDGRKLMEEVRDMVFYRTPGARRVFDVSVRFRATEGDVRFGDTKEGGIASVRVATSMDGNKGGLIENANGCLTQAETWGKRAAWCDYSGDVAGKRVGIAIFDHPGNFRHPTWWHVRDYGLMTANPFGLSHFCGEGHDGSHVLAAGEELAFRYRIFIHAGIAAAGRVAEQYQNFINPPVVEPES